MKSRGALNIALFAAFGGGLLSAACSADNSSLQGTESLEIAEFEAEARNAADLLGRRLKARLVSTMQAEGLLAAIEVCAEEAPSIAADVSSETGLSVRRTAMRIRNTNNAPDAWENEALEYFSRSISVGENAENLETSSVESENGQITYRWARPILLEPQCAMCHGTSISPEILTAITARYPNDEATGFEAGELRGIFSVER